MRGLALASTPAAVVKNLLRAEPNLQAAGVKMVPVPVKEMGIVVEYNKDLLEDPPIVKRLCGKLNKHGTEAMST